MRMGNLKPLVIYHRNCLDGFGAAFAAWKYFGTEGAEYQALDYAEREEYLALMHNNGKFDGRSIYILDFSFKREDTNRLISTCASTVWLDHHEAAFKDWAPESDLQLYGLVDDGVEIVLDNNKSGAVLAWEYFYPLFAPGPITDEENYVPLFLQYIQDRDLWRFSLPGTKDFTAGLSSLPQDFEVWDDLLVIENVIGLRQKGNVINEYYQTQLERAVAATKESCNIFGAEGLCCNLPPMFASEAGHILAKESGTYGATWFKDKDGNIKWSLRSIGDYNVSELAKNMGGGGHRNAAGFVLRPESGHTEKGVKVWRT